MGKIEEEDTNLRAWGAKDNLDVKGMIKTELKTKRGAKQSTKVNIVKGFHVVRVLCLASATLKI